MDSKINKQALYEIYRACRLCGVGAGYKMPIVQNIISMDDVEIELRQKIKECVKIEVTLNDRMPPLICELCIDKVNGFYDFLQLCKKTDEATRLKLGLPLQVSKSTAEDESIFGAMAPVLSNNTDVEPLAKSRKMKKNKSENRGHDVKVKPEKDASTQTSADLDKNTTAKRPGRGEVSPARDNTPPRTTRHKSSDNDDLALSSLIDHSKKQNPPVASKQPTIKQEDDSKNEQPVRGTKRMSRELQRLLDTPPNKMAKTIENKSKQQQRAPKVEAKSNNPTDRSDSPKHNDNFKQRNALLRELANLKGFKVEMTSDKNAENADHNENETKPPKGIKSLQAVAKSPRAISRSPRAVSKTPQPASRCPKAVTKPVRKRIQETETTEKKLSISKKDTIQKEASSKREAVNSKKEAVNSKKEAVNNKREAIILKREAINVKKQSIQEDAEAARLCVVCRIVFRTTKEFTNHLKKHTVSYTDSNKACNACCQWFLGVIEAQKHHAEHQAQCIPYRCMLCSTDFPTMGMYDKHIEEKQCRVSTEVPDVKCERCWKYFPTQPLLDGHRCWGKGDRPAMCIICKETVAARHLAKHEKLCKPKKGTLGTAKVDQDVLDRLKPMQVRIVKCDPLLRHMPDGHCDVSNVKVPYGLDRKYHYPYAVIKPRTRPGPKSAYDKTATTNDGDKQEFDYIHWDSDDHDMYKNGDTTTVPSLRAICLKVIYSAKMLGKVPKGRRRKTDFDSNELRVNIAGVNNVDDSEISPKLGVIESYRSLVDNEVYNSDGLNTFRGFDSRSLVESNSNDSESLVTNFTLGTNKNVVSDNSVKYSSDEDWTTADQIRKLDTSIDINKDKYERTEATDDCSTDGNLEIYVSKQRNIEISDVKHTTEETKVHSGSLENNVVNNREDLKENDNFNKENIIEAPNDNGTENSTDVNTFREEVLLNVNEVNIQNENTKISDSNSDDDSVMGDIAAICENLSEKANDEKMDYSDCLGNDSLSAKQVNNVCESVNNRVESENGHEISEVNFNKNIDVNIVSSNNINLESNNSNLDMQNVISTAKTSNNCVNSFKNDSFSIYNLLNDKIPICNDNKTKHVSYIHESVNSNKEGCINNSVLNNEHCKTINDVHSVDNNINMHTNDKFHYDNSNIRNDNVCYDDKIHHENDKIHLENDKVHYDNDKIQHENDKGHNECVHDSNKPTNEYNKENFNATIRNISTNDIQTIDSYTNEKLCLDDLLKSRDAELDGMDLDSVSDDDFQFE